MLTQQGYCICAGIALETAILLLQVRRGTRLVIMDQNGGADAIAIARSVRELACRKVYVVSVRHLPHVLRVNTPLTQM